MDCHAPDAAPAALDDLIAAGLVSHEVIGDPGRLGAEAETLRTLCGLVGGPVWRVDAFHYAFRAQPGDLGGRLADAAPEDWTAALEAALQAALGADAIWVSPADIVAEAADLEAPLLFLRAQAAAVEGAIAQGPAAPPPGVQAIVSARYAAEVARLTAGAAPGGALDARLAAIEAGLARLEASAPGPDITAIETVVEVAVGRALGAGLAEVLRRLAAQDTTLDAVAGQLAGLAAATSGDFQETIGLTLAEFLARIETRAEPVPAPARLS